MKKRIGVLVMVVMAMIAFVIAILSIGTNSGERKWAILDMVGRAVNALNQVRS